MEPSRKRTPMIYRSKAVCAIALAVGFGCAVFGVGGATAGNGTYFRHVRESRLERKLAGLALAHRSPEQLVLAITPKPKAHIEDTTAAVPPAATTPAAITTPATTTTAPATTTTSTSATDTTTSPDPGSESASESAATTPTTTTTTTPTTTTTGTTTTGTTTTGITTPTTTTPTTTTPTTTTPTTTTTGTTTTTTGTTTTGTTTTTTGTTTTGTPDAGSLPIGHGRPAATTGSGSTTSSCHGRCDGLTGSSGVVPASLPSSTSSSNSSSLSIGSVTTPLLAAVPTTSVNDSVTGTINPISSTTPASTPTPPVSSPAPTPPSLSLVPGLENIISSSRSAINDLTQSSGPHHSPATLPTATGGTGTTTAGGATGAGPAGTAAAGTAGTAGTAAAGAGAATHTPAHKTAKHPSSGGSAFTSPFSTGAGDVIHFVKFIPTLVWIALGAAFALMLAFAGIAFRSSRRARRREKEFAAISAAALTDALTGILNRRGFTEAAERELARASRYDRPFVLAYVDVRGLKTVNDTEGHLMGDELIKTVAGLMKESARADDVVGRIGGDEFALLLGEQTAESAGPVVRRIQAHVAEARAATEISVPWELTIGMASFPDDGATLEELLDVADRRLYEQRGIALR